MGNRSSYGQLSRSLTISSAYTIEYNAEEGENTDSVKTNGTLVYENKLANNAPANTYDAEKPEFEIDGNGVLTQYNGEGGEVVLPETVKEIAYGVFSNNSITKVTVNEGCVKIGSNVFANARNLREAVLPSTLEYIDYSAFAGAIRLEKINLEDTKVNYYGGNCFMYTALKEITVPSAGTEITMGVNAIAYMPKLTKATVNADVNTLSGIFVGCTKLEEVVLNGKVGLITNYSFCDNAGIKKLVFNNEIGQIGDEYITRIDDYDSPIGSVAKVFCSMSSLEEVVFSADIGGFYGYAFNANPSLCKVVFGGNVGYFSPYAFQYNQKLTHFELSEGNDNFVYDAETGLLYNKDKTEVYKPGEWDYDGIFEVPETLAELPRLSEASSVCLKVWTELKISDEGFKDVSTLIGIDLQAAEYIGADAFRNTGLTEALIGNYTEFIGGFAFADCASLTTVRVEANACAFDYPTVFEGCDIEIFNVDEDNGHFTVDDHGCIYSKDYSILYRYVGEGEKNVIVNEGVTYIAADAFLGNEEIESVVSSLDSQNRGRQSVLRLRKPRKNRIQIGKSSRALRKIYGGRALSVRQLHKSARRERSSGR